MIETPADIKLTADQFANLFKEKKPHLFKIEEKVRDLEYGEMECRLFIRAGEVEKVVFISHETWLRPKQGH